MHNSFDLLEDGSVLRDGALDPPGDMAVEDGHVTALGSPAPQ